MASPTLTFPCSAEGVRRGWHPHGDFLSASFDFPCWHSSPSYSRSERLSKAPGLQTSPTCSGGGLSPSSGISAIRISERPHAAGGEKRPKRLTSVGATHPTRAPHLAASHPAATPSKYGRSTRPTMWTRPGAPHMDCRYSARHELNLPRFCRHLRSHESAGGVC